METVKGMNVNERLLHFGLFGQKIAASVFEEPLLSVPGSHTGETFSRLNLNLK